MSADNGIYVLHTNDGYRVEHLQAIENIYWGYVCCDNPNVIVKEDFNSGLYQEVCLNCHSENPRMEQRDTIWPDRLKEMFGECQVFDTKEAAWKEAESIYNEIMNDSVYPIVEYGIQFIEYSGDFPR
jgi:hypothetical protein